LIELSVRIIKMADALPDSFAGRHVAHQILRSGTSPAPNYAEARGAESRNDFRHKMGIVHKELNETVLWLKVIRKTNMINPAQLDGLLDEARQLARIITQSVKTIRSRVTPPPMENGK